MAFQFAYSLDSDPNGVIKDFPLDTAANYKTSAGTNDTKKGDLVFQSSGLLRRAIATTGATTTVGVVEGGEFVGLVQPGQPYAAAKAGFMDSASDVSRYPNGVSKVRMDKGTAVYRVPVKSGQTATNANLGTSCTISLDAAGDQTADIATLTTPCVKIVDRSPDGKTVFVTLL